MSPGNTVMPPTSMARSVSSPETQPVCGATDAIRLPPSPTS